MKPTVIVYALALCLSTHTCLANTETDTQKKGYHWYQDPVKPEKEKPLEQEQKPAETTYRAPPVPPLREMIKMHPDHLAKLLEEHRKYAVYTLDAQDVANYYIVQDAVRRKSAAFTALTSVVMLENPKLNARSAYPVSTSARSAARKNKDQQIARKLAANRQRYALGFFTSPTCSYCVSQKPALEYFKENHRWTVKEIDITARPDIATRFNVTTTPMLILMERGSKRWQPVAVGEEPASVIELRTYQGIRLLQGEIQRHQFDTTESQKNGFFDPSL